MPRVENDAIGWMGIAEGGKLKDVVTDHWLDPKTWI